MTIISYRGYDCAVMDVEDVGCVVCFRCAYSTMAEDCIGIALGLSIGPATNLLWGSAK